MTKCNKHYIRQTISSMKEGCEICYEIAKTKLEENRRVLDEVELIIPAKLAEMTLNGTTLEEAVGEIEKKLDSLRLKGDDEK